MVCVASPVCIASATTPSAFQSLLNDCLKLDNLRIVSQVFNRLADRSHILLRERPLGLETIAAVQPVDFSKPLGRIGDLPQFRLQRRRFRRQPSVVGKGRR